MIKKKLFLIGVGALIADIKTEFFADPKSWILVLSLVVLNASKSYRNFKGDDGK